MDPEQAAANVASMDQVVLNSLGSERFNALLLGLLAAMALVAGGGRDRAASSRRWCGRGGGSSRCAWRSAPRAADVLQLVLAYGLQPGA